MKLDLTSRNLRRLCGQSELTAEDALKFIRDFCTDFKDETGAGLDRSRCKDPEELYRNLPWLGRLAVSIGRTNEDMITAQDRRTRLADIAAKTDDLCRQTENARQDYEVVRGELDRQKAREEELQAVLDEKKALEDELTGLRARIRRIESIDLEELKEQREELLRRKAEAEAENAELDRQNREIGAAIAEAEKAAEESRTAYNEKVGERDRLDQKRGRQKADNDQLQKEIDQIESDIDQEKDLAGQLYIKKKDALLHKEELEKAINNADVECRNLQDQVDVLGRVLAQNDFTERKEQLKLLLEEKQQEAKAVEQEKASLNALKDQLELAKAERRAAVDEQQQIKEQIQHEMDVMSARLDELTKANADSEQQKKKLQSTIDEYEARVSVAENWMRSLEAEQYRSEAKKLEEYLDSLNSVRRRIEVEWNSRWAKSRELQTSEELQPSRILREDMSGIRSRLHAYQEELTRVIRLLGSREVRS